ncbi:hypothetical protein NOF04DRAFT_1324760 [Fusarium oxysporum II5]|nr:hypothetical protein NOF04DRAFT_1324760 [Fusarium oxysporum II5]
MWPARALQIWPSEKDGATTGYKIGAGNQAIPMVPMAMPPSAHHAQRQAAAIDYDSDSETDSDEESEGEEWTYGERRFCDDWWNSRRYA